MIDRSSTLGLAPGLEAFDLEKNNLAYKLLLPLGEAGDVTAQLYLGRVCERIRPIEETASWYRRAQENGCVEATYELAQLYLRDNDGDVSRRAEAHDLMQCAAAHFLTHAEKGDPRAQFLYGKMHWLGEIPEFDRTVGLKWLRKASRSGNADYQTYLSSALWFADDDFRDIGEAVKWMKRAAAGGVADAAYQLGAAYASGDVLPKDLSAAARWYRKSAKLGNSEAKYNLGLMHCSGDGVRWSLKIGRRLIQEAAEEGDFLAQDFLADALRDGLFEFPINVDRSRFWRNKASSQLRKKGD